MSALGAAMLLVRPLGMTAASADDPGPVSLDSFAADGNGGFSRIYTIPEGTTPGAQTIVVTGAASGSVSLDPAVTAPPTPQGSGLAFTGSMAMAFPPLALLNLVAGAALITIVHRRQNSLEQG